MRGDRPSAATQLSAIQESTNDWQKEVTPRRSLLVVLGGVNSISGAVRSGGGRDGGHSAVAFAGARARLAGRRQHFRAQHAADGSESGVPGSVLPALFERSHLAADAARPTPEDRRVGQEGGE